MDCEECKLLADQASLAEEEVEKIRERVVAVFSAGTASPALIRSLEAAERSHKRCLAAIERHTQSHFRSPSGPPSSTAAIP